MHLMPLYEGRELGSFNRDELQDLLDAKASAGLSLQHRGASALGPAAGIAHGRAGRPYLRNPAELLFIPRDAKRPEHTVMTSRGGTDMFCSP